MTRATHLGFVLVGAALAGSAAADEEAPPKDWREAAARAGLAAADVERLGATKVLVTGRSYRQAFSPYIGSDIPVFVTSDSILAGYHVLLEDGVRAMERARSRRLPEFVRAFWDGVPKALPAFHGLDATLVADATRRAQVTIGTALRLVGAEAPGASPEVAKLVDEETKRVEAAQARTLPAWLGTSDADLPFIDYGRFRPRGFYDGDERLSRYFRAVAWLQAVPFRVKKDVELVAALLLREAFHDSGPAGREDFTVDAYRRWAPIEDVSRGLAAFLGSGGDISITDSDGLSTANWDAHDLVKARDDFASRAARRGGASTSTAGAVLRILPAAQTPDGLLFEQTTEPAMPRKFPSGLDVAAAVGSSFARKLAVGAAGEGLSAALDRWPTLVDGRCLYGQYLGVVAALVDAPEKDAPNFVRGEAWQAKSANAVLAGWAQLRHTWTLQAKEEMFVLAASSTEPGFVEPAPEFFARLASLAERTAQALGGSGAFDVGPARADLSDVLRRFLDVVRRSHAMEKGPKAFAGLDGADLDALRRMGAIESTRLTDLPTLPRDDDPEWRTKFRAHVERIGALARALDGDGALDATLAEILAGEATMARDRWVLLGTLCRRLEAMAHKELRRVAWSDDEKKFLCTYGEALADVMLYGGNAYLDPLDDAPRATSVFARIAPGESPGYLHVGVGRPRELLVLYPQGDRELLCRGAVMPYYETVRDARMTDAEWRSLLDAADAPAPPAWFGSVASPLAPTPPK